MRWTNPGYFVKMNAKHHQVDSLAMFYTSIGDGKEGVQAFLEKRPARFASQASDMPPFYPWW